MIYINTIFETNLHFFNMFNRKYAFDFYTNFIFSIDELSEKILNNTLNEYDKKRYGVEIVEKKMKFIKFLCDKGIISTAKPTLNNNNPKFKITTISLFLTNNCNLRCKYCYEKDLNKTNNMSKDVVKSSVDLLYNNIDEKTIPTISLFGGEPLLNIELIEYINSYVKLQKLSNCRFSITTNGTVMNNKIYSLLNTLDTKIMLSLDGSKEKHDYNRKFENGIGSYDKVKSNVDEYLQQDIPDIIIRNTITKNDVDYKNTYEFFKTSGYRNLISIPISTSDGDEKLNKDDINKLIDNCKMIAEDVLSNILSGKEFININFFNYGKIYNSLDNSYCGAGLRSIAINTNGDIYHCHRFVGDSSYKLGNVITGVDDKRITTMQNYYYNRLNDVLLNCKDCWAFNLCKGGCMHENFLEGNSVNSTDHVLCNLRRSWFEITLALYAMICEKEPTLIEKVYGENIFNNKLNKWIPLNIN